MAETLDVRAMTDADLPQVVALHLRCFKKDESYAIALGERFVAASYRFFLRDAKSFAFVATVGGQIVGVVTGRLESAYGPGLRRFTLPAAIVAFLTNPRLLIEERVRGRAAKIFRRNFLDRRPPGVAPQPPQSTGDRATRTSCLAYFAAHPDYGHLRINDALLEHVERYSRDKGMAFVEAGVRKDNVRARFSYKKRGYAREERTTGDVGFLLDLERR